MVESAALGDSVGDGLRVGEGIVDAGRLGAIGEVRSEEGKCVWVEIEIVLEFVGVCRGR